MIVTAEHFAPGVEPGIAPAPPAFIRPRMDVFSRRAVRLRTLAAETPLRDFLIFLADLSDIQSDLGPVGQGWAQLLPPMLKRVRSLAAPSAVNEAVTALEQSSGGDWAECLDRWLAGQPRSEDVAASVFLIAALQVERVVRAQTAMPAGLGHGLCPLCGGNPVAATLGTQGQVVGLRYLHCGLCATAWHLERTSCSQCQSDGKLIYHHLDGYSPTVKAEGCGACGTYIKLFDVDKNPEIEPLADDLASLSLDTMLTETSLRRAWPNPFLFGA